MRFARTASASQDLQVDRIYCGDARELLRRVNPESVALSFWSPPYFVGKSYEKTWSFEDWSSLISDVIHLHFPIVSKGGFLAINIADILAFPDPYMPRIQADNVASKRQSITREQILAARATHPDYNRYQLAALLGCSEQTIQRRTEHNNVRGGKYEVQRKVKLVGGLVQGWAEAAGFYLYDRRVWVKDPCWENSRWHSLSYRSVDEFEYVYVFWKPGITTIDRARLTREEWSDWGSRAVWTIASVRSNDEHEAQFPAELPRRVIRLFSAPGDIVLDPFIGGGTTALAAIQHRRHYLGFELLPEYASLACTRISRITR
jgi:site-specific DNA-methyltransferase (adenine-specific)